MVQLAPYLARFEEMRRGEIEDFFLVLSGGRWHRGVHMHLKSSPDQYEKGIYSSTKEPDERECDGAHSSYDDRQGKWLEMSVYIYG